MPNHNQLNLLTTTQSSLIDAALSAGSLKVAEMVKIYWPTSTSGTAPAGQESEIGGGAVIWDDAEFFHVTESGTTISRALVTTGMTVNRQCYAHTNNYLDADGEAFEFIVPVPTTPGVITIGLGSTAQAIDCGDESTIYGSACGWLYSYPWFNFEFDPLVLGQSKARVNYDSGATTATFDVTSATVYRIVRCASKAKFYADGVLKATSTSNVPAQARLTVWIDFSAGQEASVGDLIKDAKMYTDVSCSTGLGGTAIGGDGPKVYSWWNALADSAYTAPLTDWLAGAPLIPGFIAQDAEQAERFHDIPRTAALSDDVIQMRFVNYGRVFEELCYRWRGGVRAEVFYFLPEIADDANSKDYTVISWFLGHLRKADRANEDFVDVAVRNGFRSPHVLVPSRIQGGNCQWYYNGEQNPAGDRIHPTGLPGNPCDIDLHYGGTRGTVDPDTSELWATCNKTLVDCTKINGTLALAREIYGGDDYVTESTQIGLGDHRTLSRTVGNEVRLENLRVIYGDRHVKALQLKRYAKEYNPSEDNQDAGTIRTVFAVSEGPVQSITAVKVMDRDLPRSDGMGLEVRLGTQRQSATTYTSDMLPLNRTAHFRGDLNPIDPNGVQPQDIVGECVVEGRNTVKVYAADGSYTEAYTNNRADCLVELLTDQVQFGYRMDVDRLYLQDIVDLRAYNSPFDADVQARTIQQQIEDITLAAVGDSTPGWFRPFVYNGKWRFLPILDTDLTLSDIPQIKSDFGATRNVLFDRSTNLAHIEPSYLDNDEIPNAYTVTIEDANNGNIERPLTFNSDLDQTYEGLRFGDTSKRRDPRAVAGFGLTTEARARVMGEFLVKVGPWATGGLMNNCALRITICAVSSLALNLHENKILKFPTADNDRLTHYEDALGTRFQYFMVTGMRRTSRLELEVTLQAWSQNFWTYFCFEPGGEASGYVTWPAGDDDVIDGAHGVRTQIYSVSADRSASSVTYPDSIDPASVTFDSWTHTVVDMPTSGNSYDVHNVDNTLGFKVWDDGHGYIFYGNGDIDFATFLAAGSIGIGDTLGVQYDDTGANAIRNYLHNGVIVRTDNPTAWTSQNAIIGVCNTTGDTIGDIAWTVEYSGCTADYAVQGVGQSGGSTTATTTETFDVLAYQVFDFPDDVLQVEMFSEDL